MGFLYAWSGVAIMWCFWISFVLFLANPSQLAAYWPLPTIDQGGVIVPRLLVGALPNDSRYTPAAYQEFIARESYSAYEIGYRRLGGTWFVLSGEGKGKTFYEKVMFSCGGRLINSFAMIYPTEHRHIFDPVVERIEDTFRPGRECGQRAGLTAPPPEEAPAVGRRSENRRHYGQRSALADRIARQRGQNVIVVLRRRGPPYDYKVLRGYVSRP